MNKEEDLNQLIAELTLDAYGDDERLWSFHAGLEDRLTFPLDGHVVGHPVQVTRIDYNGNERRGLTARCLSLGSVFEISLADVVFSPALEAYRLTAAYRKWLGLEPWPPVEHAVVAKSHKATVDDIEVAEPVRLEILSATESNARCVVAGTEREVTWRSSDAWGRQPGEVITVKPRKFWTFAGHPYISGELVKK